MANSINQTADAMLDSVGIEAATSYKLGAFAGLVQPGGAYDFKSHNAPYATPRFSRNGTNVKSVEPFGNWHYGFFGKLLSIDLSTLKFGAQLAQLIVSQGLDDPIDQANIELGYNAANSYLAENSNLVVYTCVLNLSRYHPFLYSPGALLSRAKSHGSVHLTE